MQNNKIKLPELLAPAGSPTALRAAIEGGADAVYMGGAAFNARINAKNFSADELREGIALAHSYGVKIYIAANTLIFDREREDYLRAAEQAYLAGADALIVADIGMARELSRRIPIELHASTQISGHCLDAARLLADAGFSRMVCARETSREDLEYFCKNSPIESEVFVHGALCVSTSGQCLFSSVVGGRSGNRGECAQPCRLPYTAEGGKQTYPLSLCDLSLARHITELCDMGVSSFKIEGRMKSPEYVRDVTRIWRRLLDEGRNANDEDMAELARIFSRGGFTDGYYTGRVDKKMLGIRRDTDKQQSAALTPFDKITKKIDISLSAKITADAPISLSATSQGRSVCVYGDVPQRAINAPLTREVVERNLTKLGATVFTLRSFELELEDGLMLPISALNSLRRSACEALAPANERGEADLHRQPLLKPRADRTPQRSALFYDPSAIPAEARSYFDDIFVPLEEYSRCADSSVGVMLPEVIFDSQRDTVSALLKKAYEGGSRKALVCNLGHVELARSHGFALFGDLRLNIANPSAVAALEALGIEQVIASPELTLPQLRDLGGNTSVVVYGRLPLMLTEKCVGKELGSCKSCEEGRLSLVDRTRTAFPVRRRFGHRSVIFNSVPVYMADRAADLRRAGISSTFFIFSTETKKQVSDVIRAYEQGLPPTFAVRRIK